MGVGFMCYCFFGDSVQCFVVEFEFCVFKVKQCLILFGQGVFWFFQDLDQGFFVQFVQGCYYWQMVDEFWDQIKFDQIFWFDLSQQFFFVCFVGFCFYCCVKINVGVGFYMVGNYFVQVSECVVVDKQDFGGINLQEFLLWMFMFVLWWNGGNGFFDKFQQCLLYVFV